jgi:hypothetical protein
MYPPSGDSPPGDQSPHRPAGNPPEFGGQPGPYQPGQPAGPGGYPQYPPQQPAGPGGYPQQPADQNRPPEYPAAPGFGQPAGFPPPPVKKKSKLPLILGLVAGAILLVCGLGVVAVLVAGQTDTDEPLAVATSGAPSASTSPAGDAAPKASASSTLEPIEGDLEKFKKGDCLTMTGADKKVDEAKCTAPGAYRVLLKKTGTLADAACEGTDASYILTNDVLGTSGDFVLCIGKVS